MRSAFSRRCFKTDGDIEQADGQNMRLTRNPDDNAAPAATAACAAGAVSIAGTCDRPVDGQNLRISPIQELPEPERPFRQRQDKEPDMGEYWKRKKTNSFQPSSDVTNILAYIESCKAHECSHVNAFFDAFLFAYNHHQDVLIAPDDVWLLICMQFSKYINDNAEQLRERFVDNEGQKNLTVTTWNESSESQWEEFLELMQEEISKNTKENIVNILQSNFSTSGLVERMLSTACIMDSFKKYFSYGRCIPCCGIRNACFLGTAADWQQLLAKTGELRKYDINGQWTKYISAVEVILGHFLSTFNGQVDVDWWNRVMNMTHGRLGSGSTTYYSGWLLHFFGKYEPCESSDISSYSIDVPVKIDNKLTGEKKTVHLVGGFGGVHAVDLDGRKAFRPQISMIVYHDPTSKDDQAAARDHFQ